MSNNQPWLISRLGMLMPAPVKEKYGPGSFYSTWEDLKGCLEAAYRFYEPKKKDLKQVMRELTFLKAHTDLAIAIVGKEMGMTPEDTIVYSEKMTQQEEEGVCLMR